MKQYILLGLLAFSFLEAKQSFEINHKQIENLMKKNNLIFISINKESQWKRNTVKVKSLQRIGKGLLEFKYPELNLNKYKKDTPLIIFTKDKSNSIAFAQKLKELGFTKVKYLKDGYKAWDKILRNFRGIKLFSMFRN